MYVGTQVISCTGFIIQKNYQMQGMDLNITEGLIPLANLSLINALG